MCLFIFLLSEKVSLQMLQFTRILLWIESKCFLKSELVENFLSQEPQAWSLIWLWILFLCCSRFLFSEQEKSQSSHLNGFNFKWTDFTWESKKSFRLNVFLQIPQTNFEEESLFFFGKEAVFTQKVRFWYHSWN